MISLGNKDYKLYLGGQRMRQTIMRSDNPKSSLINERHRFSCLLIRLTSSTNKRLDIRANGRESQAWHEARLRVDYKACSRASTALQFPAQQQLVQRVTMEMILKLYFSRHFTSIVRKN